MTGGPRGPAPHCGTLGEPPQTPPSPLPCRSLGRHLIVTGDLSPEPSHSQASGKACPFCTAALRAGPQVTPGQSSKRGQSHPATPQTLPLTTRGQTAPAWPLPLRPLRQAQVSGLCVPPGARLIWGPRGGPPPAAPPAMPSPGSNSLLMSPLTAKSHSRGATQLEAPFCPSTRLSVVTAQPQPSKPHKTGTVTVPQGHAGEQGAGSARRLSPVHGHCR